MLKKIKLIVGLGNIGAKYALTRHNAGFLFVDILHTIYEFDSYKSRFKGEFCKGKIDKQSILLLKPQTFMNLSGEALLPAMQFYKIKPEEILVVHDDIDLKFSDIRFKQGGGDAGHNGLKDISAKIGKNYWRMRIGVGRPEFGDVSDYVLGKFPKDEFEKLAELLQKEALEFSENKK